jgi:hypothetical protein
LETQLRGHFSTPEAREEISVGKKKIMKNLGLTGNPQYDNFIKRAEYARWEHSVKDLPFSHYP